MLSATASLMVAVVPSAMPRSLNLCPGFSSSHSEIQVYCGRGDRKTAIGKQFAHTFSNARPRNKKKGRGPPRILVNASPLKPDELVQDSEEVPIETNE